MSVSHRRAALLAAAGLATVTLTPVASFAETWSHNDPAGDMVAVDDTGTATPAPDAADSDVIRTSAKLGTHWLRLRTTFADLGVSDSDSINPQWRVRTSAGRGYVVNAFASQQETAGEWQIMRASGNGVSCPRLAHTIDYTAHTMTAWVPAGGLGNPRWVRVGATGTTLHLVANSSQDSGSTIQSFTDDAQQVGTVSARPVLGPRVHRW